MRVLVPLMVLLFVTMPLYGQVKKHTADSLIIQRIGNEFFDRLVFSLSVKTELLAFDNLTMNSHLVDGHIFVYYFKNESGLEFCYRRSGVLSCALLLAVKTDGELVEPANLDDVGRIVRLWGRTVVTREIALGTAITHLTNRKVKQNNCHLVYDLDNSTVTWEIRSDFGFFKRTEETVLVNALTGEFIRIDKFAYRRFL